MNDVEDSKNEEIDQSIIKMINDDANKAFEEWQSQGIGEPDIRQAFKAGFITGRSDTIKRIIEGKNE